MKNGKVAERFNAAVLNRSEAKIGEANTVEADEVRTVFIDGYYYEVYVKNGKVAERFNAAVLKTVEGASPPGVRISPFPPTKKRRLNAGVFLLMGGRFERTEKGVRLQAKGERERAGRRAADERRSGADFFKKNQANLPLSANKETPAECRCFFVDGGKVRTHGEGSSTASERRAGARRSASSR